MGLKSTGSGVLKRKGNLDTETKTHRGKGHGKTGRDWSDVSISQRMPKSAGNHQKLEEERKGPSLEPSETAWFCQSLDF